MDRMRTILCCALASMALAGSVAASAQKPTRRHHPIGGWLRAGGPTDIPARFVAEKLGDALGQRVIVENKPAASGMLAARDVLSQPRDGYNLLFCTHFEAINTAVYKNPQFKLAEVAPILAGRQILLRSRARQRHSRDRRASFVQYAKAHPGEVSYGTVGAGSAQEILARQLEKLTGITIEPHPVPRRPAGGAGAGRGALHFYVSPTLAIVPQYEAKQLKILGGLRARAAQVPRGDSDPDGEGRRLRALRLARHLRRRRHAATDHRPAATPISRRSSPRPSTGAMIEKAGSIAVSSTPQELQQVITQTLDMCRPASASSACRQEQ